MRLDPDMMAAAQKVHVNIPYRMYREEAHLRSLFDHLRLNPEFGMDAQALARYTDGDFNESAQHVEDLGCRITLHGPFEGVDLGADNTELLLESHRLMERLLEAAAIMKPQTVVCHTGYSPGEAHSREWIKRARKAWAHYAEAFHDKGTALLLENVHEPSAGVMAMLTEGIPHLGVCLDTGHLNAYGDGDLNAWVRLLGEATREIHLHDNHGGEDLHLPPGEGSMDLTPAMELARQKGVIVTLEPHVPEDLPAGLAFVAQSPGF